ncbi:MAG: hypothetical protein AAF990_14630 [Bacteroidota bacterium]
MKFVLLFVCSFFLIGLQTCKQKNKPSETSNLPSLGDTLQVNLDQALTLAKTDVQILFHKFEESRCPLNTNCIREGEAIASVRITQKGKQEEIKLEAKGLCQSDNGKCGQSVSVNGYQYRLLNIYPYPTDTRDDSTPYLKLIVTKAESS